MTFIKTYIAPLPGGKADWHLEFVYIGRLGVGSVLGSWQHVVDAIPTAQEDSDLPVTRVVE